MQGTLISVSNGDEPGYSVRGALNVPLGETFAVRASAFTRREAGYIDNVRTGEEGINRVDVEGARLSALWRPSPDTSLKLSALFQDAQAQGSAQSFASSGYSDLQQGFLSATGGHHREMQAYSATLTTRLGAMELTAVSGYGINTLHEVSDASFLWGELSAADFNVPNALARNTFKTRKLTQELRLAGAVGEKAEWLLGAYYADEKSRTGQDILAAEENGAVADIWFIAKWPTTYSEYAGFTDLTYHFTERFDIQIGGRESSNRQTYSEVDAGHFIDCCYGIPSPAITPKVVTKDSAFTYLVTPRFRFSQDLMAYARLASGFRTGGPNATCSLFGFSCHFQPDKTMNYEIGLKGAALERALTFDASVYYIDWKDIQLFLFDSNTNSAYYGNGSRGKSQGAELSVEARAGRGLSITAWVGYNDAELSEELPADALGAVGESGERLPYSSRWSGSLSIDRSLSLPSKIELTVGAAASYIGDRANSFRSDARTPRLIFPSYVKVDLRAALQYGSWTANAFVNNRADRRGIIGVDSIVPSQRVYIQPRTIGLSLARTF